MAREITYVIKVLQDQAEEKIRRMERAYIDAAKAAGTQGFAKAEREFEKSLTDAERAMAKQELAIAKWQDSNVKADKQTQSMIGTLGKVASAVGIAFSVKQVVDFGVGLVRTGSELVNLHAKTNISIGALQDLGAIATRSGTTLSAMTDASFMLQKRLAAGDESLAAGLAAVGLSFDRLRALSPEEQIYGLARALQGIEDPTERAKIAWQLFGQRAQEIMPALMSNIDQIRDETVKMSDESAQALDGLGNQWDRFLQNLQAKAGNFLSWTQAHPVLAAILSGQPGTAVFGVTAREAMIQAANDQLMGGLQGPTLPQIASIAQVQVPTGIEAWDLDRQSKALEELAKRNAAVQEAAAKAAADATASSIDRTAGLWDDYFAMVDKGTEDALTASLNAAERWYDGELRKLEKSRGINRNYYNEVAALESVHLARRGQAEQAFIAESMQWWAAQTAAIEAELAKQEGYLRGVYVGLGSELRGVGEITIETPEAFAARLEEQRRQAGLADDALRFQFVGPELETMDRRFTDAVSGWSSSLVQLAHISQGTFGGMVQDIARVVASFAAANRAYDDFTTARREGDRTQQAFAIAQGASSVLGATGQGSTGARVAGGALSGGATGAMVGTYVFPGLGTAAGFVGGAVIGGAVGLYRGMRGPSSEEREGRDVAGQYIESFGGFDAMLQRIGETYTATGRTLEQARADVESLMAATRLGGDAVSAVISQINRAADDLQLQEEAINKVTEAAERCGFTIDQWGPVLQRQELDKQFGVLYQDYQLLIGASFEQVDVTRQMSGSVSQYVQDVTRMGQEVPSAMRPMLETFAANGDLLDANGNRITDLEAAGVRWAESTTEQVSRIVTSVDRLVEALTLGLANAIRTLPQPNIQGRVSWAVDPPPGAGSGAEWTSPELASRGGIASAYGLQYFEQGKMPWEPIQWIPRGLDVMPAMIRYDEMILTPEHQRVVGALLRRSSELAAMPLAPTVAAAPARGDQAPTVHVAIGQIGLQESESVFRERVGRAVVAQMRNQGVRFANR
ncbi:MAG: hypothetical protein AB7J63_19675 [Vicinamibacterales bacterium]